MSMPDLRPCAVDRCNSLGVGGGVGGSAYPLLVPGSMGSMHHLTTGANNSQLMVAAAVAGGMLEMPLLPLRTPPAVD